MPSTKTFSFIRRLVAILSVCTDEIIEVTSNYATNNETSSEPVVTASEPVAEIPTIDLSSIPDQLLTSRTVYTKPVDLTKKLSN